MFRYIIVIIFIGITTQLFCQSPDGQQLTDSLFQNWQNESNSIENRRDNFDSYIWKTYLFFKPDSAEVLARQLIDFCEKNDDLLGEGKGLNTLAISYALRNNYKKATEIFQENLIVYQKAKRTFSIGNTYNNIGNCYYEQDLFYQSLDYYNKALLVFDGMLDTCGQKTEEEVRIKMKQTYTTVVGVYIGLDELEKAKEIYEKNIKNISQINAEIDASFLYQKSASLEIKSGNPEKVLEEVEKAITEARKFNNKRILGLSLQIKSDIYAANNDFDTAISLLEESNSIFQEIKNSKGEIEVKLSLINVLLKKGALKKALKYLKETEKISKERKLNFAKSGIYKAYSDYYSKVGKTDKAYTYLKQYHALEDSIQQQQNDKLLTSLEDKYAYEAELSNQALKIEIEKKNTKTTRIILLIVGISAVILAILTFRFFHLNKRLKTQKMELIQKQNALNESLQKLEESNYNLQQFAGAAAHDLKGPLRTISSFTTLINRKYRKLVKSEDTEYFDFILRGSRAMEQLINGLLQYSSMSNQAIEIEQIDLNKLFQEVVLSLDTNIKEANADIQIQDNLPLSEGQYTLLFQVFSNLVNNAIKFRKSDVPLSININCVATQNNDYQVVEIQDNGIGIENNYKQEVFKVFKKLHNSTEYEGVGLGLSLSKKIIERLGGEVWLESEFGVGTTLFVKLSKAQSMGTTHGF